MRNLENLRAQYNSQNVKLTPNTCNSSSTPGRFHRNSGEAFKNGDNNNNNVLLRDKFRINDLIPDSFDFNDHSSENLSYKSKTPPEENFKENNENYHTLAPTNNSHHHSHQTHHTHQHTELDELEIQLSGYAEEGIKTLVAVLYCSCCFL